MAGVIYIKNASGGSGGGDATAANQVTQISLETDISQYTQATQDACQAIQAELPNISDALVSTSTGTTEADLSQLIADRLIASGLSAADYLKSILTSASAIQSSTSSTASNTGARSVSVAMTSVTVNTTIAAGFSSYTFVNQGTQPATINTVLNLPVGASFTINFDRNETSATTFAIAFAITTGANVCVITNS